MTMIMYSNNKASNADLPESFNNPTALPESAEQARAWQAVNRSWWESHPMRYDWDDPLPTQEFSRAFYEEIDRRFLADVREYMPWQRVPFDRLVDYAQLGRKNVLEIGVGNGTTAGLLAQHAGTFTGIDITDYAVKSTSGRFACFGLPGQVVRMDAERMAFPDGSFDLVWSWGVIHHSADTRRVLQEIKRVVRPGGQVTVMVYYRSWWYYYILGGVFHGLFRGSLFRTRSLHRTIQEWTDGGLARFYSMSDWRKLASEFFTIKKLEVFGSKTHLIPLPGGRLKQALLPALPNAIGRLLANQCRMGSFLVATMRA